MVRKGTSLSDNCINYHPLFGGIQRLIGIKGYEQLSNSKIAVIGIGGVGSWAAEALARTGIGEIILMDLDEICVTNTNRQLHTLQNSIGQPKIAEMAKRLKLINPEIKVTELMSFYTEKTADELFQHEPTAVIDCIDSVKFKTHLVDQCLQRKIPLTMTGGAGGIVDPTEIQVKDLRKTHNDPLLRDVRKKLRREYGYPNYKRPIGIPAVYTPSPQVFPLDNGEVSEEKPDTGGAKLDCFSGLGSATYITGIFGFYAAWSSIKQVIENDAD
jgi:tRNA A37 threonylcarbamoyladenosine dehydratase